LSDFYRQALLSKKKKLGNMDGKTGSENDNYGMRNGKPGKGRCGKGTESKLHA